MANLSRLLAAEPHDLHAQLEALPFFRTLHGAFVWVEELLGIDGATRFMRGRFTDMQRFPVEWIADAGALEAELDRVGSGP